MGPVGRLGLCLLLGALPRPARTNINECLEQPRACGPGQTCRNTAGSFHCSCSAGYRPAPPPRPPPPGTAPASAPPGLCVDVDECAEDPQRCGGGGSVCFNTPGSFECHCGPGHQRTPRGCVAPTPAVTEPPLLCSHNQSECGPAQTLPRLHQLLRGGGDPRLILRELLAVLDAALGGGEGPGAGGAAPPGGQDWASAVLAAAEEVVRAAGARLPPPNLTALASAHTELRVAVQRGPPPAPVRLQVPGLELRVPPEGAWDPPSGLALVGLLSQRGLGRVLEGAPPVQWGGWGELPPPGGRPSYRLLSPVATAFVTRPLPPGTPEVTLRFQHPPPDPRLGGRVLCAFWDPQEGLWATGGCRLVPPPAGTPPDPSRTTCACTHLTSFAVLLAFRELEDDWVLDVVTRVGLGVSVASLGVAVATFVLCRALRGLRTTLHLHLSLSLLLAHGTFLLGIERTQHPTACAVVAGLLHFSFLAAFCWMCLEGLHLYVLLVRVFVPSWLRVRHLLLLGYGLPALLVAVSAAAFPGGYGTPRYCWLSLERGFRWSFQAPVCLVIALNAVILVITIWTLVQKFNDVNPDVGHLRKMRVLAATGVGQLFVLGTGWALGLGGGLPRAGGAPSPLPLLFCALNAAQGLGILLCHCLAHPQVREAYRACLCPGTKRYSEFTSGTSGTSNTRLSRQQTFA